MQQLIVLNSLLIANLCFMNQAELKMPRLSVKGMKAWQRALFYLLAAAGKTETYLSGCLYCVCRQKRLPAVG